MIGRVVPLLSFFFLVVACTGGSTTGTGDAGASSSSGGSGGSGANTCTEFAVGDAIDPALGGSGTSQVIAQSVSDYAAAARNQLVELTAACKGIATRLGASAADQAAADGNTEPRPKADAWCKLATKSLSTAKAQAGGTLQVQFDPPECALSVQEKASCQGRCLGSPCDVAANPMSCSGGELSGSVCVGGKLEGGCAVDGKCDGSCDATVAAKADCPAASVSVTSVGAADQSIADSMKLALETELPAVLQLRAQCEIEAALAGSFSGNATSATDIKAACIPKIVSAAANGVQDVQVCFSASVMVLGTVSG